MTYSELRAFTDRWIRNSAITSFTQLRLNTVLNEIIDKAEAGGGGGGGTVEWGDIEGLIADNADLTAALTAAKARVNHTGTQSADTITDGTTNKTFTGTEKTKLSGIATAATANSSDTELRDRSTHNGFQDISSITDLQATIDLKADLVDGKVPANQLPGYVDDIVEFANLAAFPVVGSSGILYLALDTDTVYRWSGSTYIDIGATNLILGETVSTAYRGDRGKTAYDHSQSGGNPHNTSPADITGFNAAALAAAPAETTTTIGTITNGATAKSTPVDADSIGLVDSAASNILKKVTWANIKATLKSYFDSLATTLTNKTISLASNTVTGTIAEFNSAISDADIMPVNNATATGVFTAPTIQLPVNTGLYQQGVTAQTSGKEVFNITQVNTNSTGATRPLTARIETAVNPSSAPGSNTDYHGVDARLYGGGTNINNKTGFYAVEGSVLLTGNTTLLKGVGVYGLAANTDAGTAIELNAIQAGVQNTGAGAVTTAIGAVIREVDNTGTITNLYGLKVENQSAGTNSWAIHTGTGKVEFGGDTFVPTAAAGSNTTQAANTAYVRAEILSAGISDAADPTSAAIIVDDFLSATAETGEVGALGWTFTNGSMVNHFGSQNHPGCITRRSGIVAAQVSSMFLGNTANITSFRFDELNEVTFIISLAQTNADFDIRLGVTADGTSATAAHGVYFEKLSTDTQWFGVSRNGAAQTRTAALVTQSTNWIKLKLRRISSSSVGFKVDSATEVTLGTNVPDAGDALAVVMQIVPTTTTARDFHIDFFSMKLLPVTR